MRQIDEIDIMTNNMNKEIEFYFDNEINSTLNQITQSIKRFEIVDSNELKIKDIVSKKLNNIHSVLEEIEINVNIAKSYVIEAIEYNQDIDLPSIEETLNNNVKDIINTKIKNMELDLEISIQEELYKAYDRSVINRIQSTIKDEIAIHTQRLITRCQNSISTNLMNIKNIYLSNKQVEELAKEENPKTIVEEEKKEQKYDINENEEFNNIINRIFVNYEALINSNISVRNAFDNVYDYVNILSKRYNSINEIDLNDKETLKLFLKEFKKQVSLAEDETKKEDKTDELDSKILEISGSNLEEEQKQELIDQAIDNYSTPEDIDPNTL